MTATPEHTPEPGPFDNGLHAPTYVPLTDVDAEIGRHLLTALGRARIAAYLGPGGKPHRLFVASDERGDARTIVAATVRALGEADPALPAPAAADPLAGIDTNAVFEAMVADWHVDTHVAVRDAERELGREDAEWRARLTRPPAQDDTANDSEWLDDDHYVPPAPPPLPRLSWPTVVAIALMAFSIVLLGFGTALGLAGNLGLVLGVAGLLGGGAILFSRLREQHREEDDDGSAV